MESAHGKRKTAAVSAIAKKTGKAINAVGEMIQNMSAYIK
jgi:hypothetical protein